MVLRTNNQVAPCDIFTLNLDCIQNLSWWWLGGWLPWWWLGAGHHIPPDYTTAKTGLYFAKHRDCKQNQETVYQWQSVEIKQISIFTCIPHEKFVIITLKSSRGTKFYPFRVQKISTGRRIKYISAWLELKLLAQSGWLQIAKQHFWEIRLPQWKKFNWGLTCKYWPHIAISTSTQPSTG